MKFTLLVRVRGGVVNLNGTGSGPSWHSFRHVGVGYDVKVVAGVLLNVTAAAPVRPVPRSGRSSPE